MPHLKSQFCKLCPDCKGGVRKHETRRVWVARCETCQNAGCVEVVETKYDEFTHLLHTSNGGTV